MNSLNQIEAQDCKGRSLDVEIWEEVLSGERSYRWQQGLNVQPYVEVTIMKPMIT